MEEHPDWAGWLSWYGLATGAVSGEHPERLNLRSAELARPEPHPSVSLYSRSAKLARPGSSPNVRLDSRSGAGYLRAAEVPRPPALVASAGFAGPPRDGTVEIGYSVVPEFQRQGYATEMACALIEWAFTQPGVQRIIANTDADNVPSIRLLCRLGFAKVGEGAEPNSLQFGLRRPGNDHSA